MTQPYNSSAITPEFAMGGVLMCKPVVQAGPASYNNTGTIPSGSVLSASIFGFSNLAFVLAEAQDSSGTYWCQVSQPAGPGSSTFTLQIFSVGGSTEVVNATNLSAYFFRLWGFGN